MGVTASRLRAVVTADTAQASADMRQFGQTVNDTAATSNKALSGLSSLVRGDLSGAFSMLAGGAALTGVAAAAIGITKVAVSMDDARQQAENMRKELTAYAGSASKAEAATQALVNATDGGISRLDATAQASRLLSMGLATTSDQVGQLSRMAVMLGDKTLSVEQRMESFNAMLANQSIERLDTFGISSGRVRQRIEELQAAMPGLSREQAFVNATLEIGAEKLKSVEAQGVTAATSMQKLGAALSDLKAAAADKIHVQIVVDTITKGVQGITEAINGPGAQEAYDIAARSLAQAEQYLSDVTARKTAVAYADYQQTLADAQAARDKAAAEAEVARILLEHANGTNTTSDAERDYIAAMQGSAAATLEAAAAQDVFNTARAGSVDWVAKARSVALVNRYEGMAGAQAAADEERARGYALLRTLETRKNEETKANQYVARDYTTRMRSAINDLSSDFKSKLTEGMNFSVGLSDLRPGGSQGVNAPGMNGAFEDIYRLQAFIQNGTWGDTASKYGLDQAGAKDLVGKFQSGIWDQSVMGAIDKGKLTEQIQQAQLGKTMMDAVAADLAKETQGDPKIIKAMLGMGEGTDGAATSQLGTTAITAMLQGIDASLAASGGTDLTKRGELAWEKMETGFIAKAEKSVAFATAVERMVDNSLKQYLPTN